MSEESFESFLQDALSVTGPIINGALNIGLPMAFGPAGGAVSALASIALNAAGKLVGGAESGFVDAPPSDDIAMRAIYAEAALQTMLKMDHDLIEEEGFIDTMKSVVSHVAPVVQRVGPKVLGVVKDEVVQMLLQHLSPETKPKAEGFFELKKNSSARKFSSQLNTGEESFMEHVAAANPAGEEGWLDLISPGIGLLTKVVGTLTESSMVDDSSSDRTLEGLQKRAVLAEAALQAVIAAKHDVLEEEGFFDDFINTAKDIGGAVLSAAPGVIKAVLPVVTPLIKGAFGAESAIATESPYANGTNGTNGLRKQRSAYSLRKEERQNNTYGISNTSKPVTWGQGNRRLDRPFPEATSIPN